MDVSLLSQLRQIVCVVCVAALLGCGGGDTGNTRDSGPDKTYLRVEASDGEGDALTYHWRATAGAIENRNSQDTVWTLPPGPGLHFAYVTVADGRGGYVEQQYAVSSDALARAGDPRPPIQRVIGRFDGFDGGMGRLRFRLRERLFVPPGGGAAVERAIDLPSVRVQLRNAGTTVFSGESDESGEVQLPQFVPGTPLAIFCGPSASDVLQDCKASFQPSATEAPTRTVDLTTIVPAGSNLRLHGHVGLSDGGTCGIRSDFAGLRSAGTVQVVDASGAPVTSEVAINRHGDYAIDAAVRVDATLRLRVRCDSLMREVDIPNVAGFTGTPLELSMTLPNSRPRIVKMVASGPEGNVRGRMIVAEAGVSSNTLPGSYQFLTYKGADTRLGACMYYKAFGAVEACDAQGNMAAPLTLEDWKRKHQLAPYAGSNVEVRATYINKMDLNLVRRMVATKTSNDNIAFYVCNHPGPDGTSQQEVTQVIDTGQRNERLIACVAMEWSVTPGVNGDKPFTEFLTFGPDGSLLPSVNLDGRGGVHAGRMRRVPWRMTSRRRATCGWPTTSARTGGSCSRTRCGRTRPPRRPSATRWR